ncbi:MAG TPA: CHRD domain-containing protein [Bacteroidota bacterium]|jgi:hypothetical protein|nr:CHRD domain-containing protein [Bacteroidota bacterium]
MRINVIFAGLTFALLIMFISSCRESASEPGSTSDRTLVNGEFNVEGLDVAAGETGVLNNPNFLAVLSGSSEVPARDTRARGVAKFRFNQTRDTVTFRLIVANIQNVVAAHIHLGPPGVIGPVIVGLYSAAPGGGRINGPIAEGAFSAADLVGPFAGSISLAHFIEELHKDSLYVNVHTNDGVGPVNTGPGDFPGGEIRGSLRLAPVTGGIGQRKD